MRPIIYIIGIATYEISQYLNKLLTTLTKLEYNILNAEDLVRRIRRGTIPAGHNMVSFDISLFTNVPLDKANNRLHFEKVQRKEKPNKHSQRSLKRMTISLHQTVTFHFQ